MMDETDCWPYCTSLLLSASCFGCLFSLFWDLFLRKPFVVLLFHTFCCILWLVPFLHICSCPSSACVLADCPDLCHLSSLTCPSLSPQDKNPGSSCLLRPFKGVVWLCVCVCLEVNLPLPPRSLFGPQLCPNPVSCMDRSGPHNSKHANMFWSNAASSFHLSHSFREVLYLCVLKLLWNMTPC